MQRAFTSVCMVLLSLGSAAADPATVFGEAVPGQSIEEVVAAMPDAEWRFFRDAPDGPLVGAISSDAIRLDDWRWTLRLGRTPTAYAGDYTYSFELIRMSRFDEQHECAEMVSRAIAAVEPSFGAYAPASIPEVFPMMTSTAARAGTPREYAAGTMSRVNVYTEGRTQYIMAARPVEIGVARIAYVAGVNTRSRALNNRMGYDCSVSIAFKAHLPSETAPQG